MFPVLSAAFIILVASLTESHAQVHSSKKIEPMLHHEIDGFVGSTHVPEGALDDSNSTLIAPNVGLNYKYWLDEHFALRQPYTLGISV